MGERESGGGERGRGEGEGRGGGERGRGEGEGRGGGRVERGRGRRGEKIKNGHGR